MKKLITFLLLIAVTVVSAQQKAYEDGEWFKFRIHYGFVTAGYATLQVNDAILNGKEVYHIKGKGETTGMSKFFFRVEDYYHSYVDKKKDIPYRFIRKIDEGGHTKDIEIDFDHVSGKALVHNKKHETKKLVDFPKDAQDMVSAFYYLRNNLDTENIQEGDTVNMDMFFDKESFKFKLKFLGREELKTEFGRVPTLKFRPYVEAGRVFKEKESLTVWVTDDGNKMPVLIKADLAVGSLKASLVEFKGLRHSFRIIVD
ncbi:MAG: ATP-dependent exonuclease [Flavobacteriaceae bacterium]|nr:ATP-dependent exonuclease [Flavobacteriaceae bacterium]